MSGHYDPSSVTVIVAARNEENTIGDVVRAAGGYCSEVVVMDGRSTDATADRARAAGARVVQDPGLGKGSAIRAGLSECATEFVVLIDADGSHDPADIPSLVGPVADGRAELCVGSRFAGGSDELSATLPQLIRTIGNILMNIAINRRWGVALTDTLNGYRALRPAVALNLSLVENSHTIEQEMVMKFLRHGYAVVNVPTHEFRRQYGESHIRIWREWPRFVWCVIGNIAARDVTGRDAHTRAPERVPGASE